MLPADPMLLLSLMNTRLRDFYPSLEELCAAEDLSREELERRLGEIGFRYDPERNQFV